MVNLQTSTSANANISVMHTSSPLRSRSHAGFSLIELLIVIALISLFGFMVFGFMQSSALKQESYTVKDLKKIFKTTKNAELVCTQKCSSCFIHPIGDASTQKIDSDLKEIQSYILDKDNNPQKVDFGRVNDEKICLRFRYYANGSTSQMIIGSEGKFFYFPSYFTKVSVYTSLDEAAEKWIEGTKLLTSQGNYY